jgi:hypothetical protein
MLIQLTSLAILVMAQVLKIVPLVLDLHIYTKDTVKPIVRMDITKMHQPMNVLNVILVVVHVLLVEIKVALIVQFPIICI